MSSSFCICLLVLLPAVWGLPATEDWHTRPDQWKEARNYHVPFDPAFAARIQMERVRGEVSPLQKNLSPNRAYWFIRGGPEFAEPGPWHTAVTIFNERDYLLRLSLLDHGNAQPIVRWINEKLLYVEVWWGRVMGSVLILDVEREEVIHREMVHWGGIAFEQWRAGGDSQKGAEPELVPKQ